MEIQIPPSLPFLHVKSPLVRSLLRNSFLSLLAVCVLLLRDQRRGFDHVSYGGHSWAASSSSSLEEGEKEKASREDRERRRRRRGLQKCVCVRNTQREGDAGTRRREDVSYTLGTMVCQKWALKGRGVMPLQQFDKHAAE